MAAKHQEYFVVFQAKCDSGRLLSGDIPITSIGKLKIDDLFHIKMCVVKHCNKKLEGDYVDPLNVTLLNITNMTEGI